MDDADVFAITRPSSRLLAYYVLRAVLVPIRLFVLPYDFFRYRTMRYRFDAEGVTMSWGVLFRREINLTYARIQDIHLTSTLLERWLGLAEIHIETASGSAGAAMTLEGVAGVERMRDFLYRKMRDARAALGSPASASPVGIASASSEMERIAVALGEVANELRLTREAIERLGERGIPS